MVGEKDLAANRCAAAYRHYARGVSLIAESYGRANEDDRIIDDTGQVEALAQVDFNRAKYRFAANTEREVLLSRLDMIERAWRCKA
jgi:hypothetical protein